METLLYFNAMLQWGGALYIHIFTLLLLEIELNAMLRVETLLYFIAGAQEL